MAVILAENWDTTLQTDDEWPHYYRRFTTRNPYGSVANMPQDDQQIVYEAFQKHAKKQQEARTDPNEFYSSWTFTLAN